MLMATRAEIKSRKSKAQILDTHLPAGLIQAIVDTVARSMIESDHHESGSEQILLDADFGGDRYLLVRMAKARAHTTLSPREIEIVRMVAKGHPNKIIADILSISAWTVCTHVRRIFAKLGVGSRAAMVAQLLECGMLSLPVVPQNPIRGTETPKVAPESSRRCG
jgi:DNA-binding CsgD family transcriptional regulator